MADITMCASKNCPIRATCYRTRAKESINQSWSNFENGFPDYIALESGKNSKIIKSNFANPWKIRVSGYEFSLKMPVSKGVVILVDLTIFT